MRNKVRSRSKRFQSVLRVINQLQDEFPSIHEAVLNSDLGRLESLVRGAKNRGLLNITFTTDHQWYIHTDAELEEVMRTWRRVSGQAPFSFYTGILEHLVPETAGKVLAHFVSYVAQHCRTEEHLIGAVRGEKDWIESSTKRVGQ